MSGTPASNGVIWQAEAQNKVLAEEVREGLREIVDPEIGLNIIELGLIRDLDFRPDSTQITMILTTPFCPYGPALIEQTRKKVADVARTPATIEMGLELWDPSMMEEGAGAEWGLF